MRAACAGCRVKRIAPAVGAGAIAVQLVDEYLEEQRAGDLTLDRFGYGSTVGRQDKEHLMADPSENVSESLEVRD